MSPATIHRDVAVLARRRLLLKVRGGVALPAETRPSTEGDSPFPARVHRETERKAAIAERALSLVEDGDVLFLDSSTTVLHLARRLRERPLTRLTLVTNSVQILQEFCLYPPHYVLIGLGGNYHCQLNAFLGRRALEGVRGLRLGKAFVSAAGASAGEVATFHEDHAAFLAAVLDRSAQRHLLLDATKFNRTALFSFAEPRRFDTLVCDHAPPREIAAAFQRVLSKVE